MVSDFNFVNDIKISVSFIDVEKLENDSISPIKETSISDKKKLETCFILFLHPPGQTIFFFNEIDVNSKGKIIL